MLEDCLLKTLGRYSLLLSARPGGLHPFAQSLDLHFSEDDHDQPANWRTSACKGECIALQLISKRTRSTHRKSGPTDTLWPGWWYTNP